jgi:hypothetical protein
MSFIEHLIAMNGGIDPPPGEPFTFETLRSNLVFAHMVTPGRRHWNYADIAACVQVADQYLQGWLRRAFFGHSSIH